MLGRIDPESRMGGPGVSLDIGGAKKAVGDLGTKLRLGLLEAAEAIIAIVNQRMAGRIRLMSIERGLDPRDFASSPSAAPARCTAARWFAKLGSARCWCQNTPASCARWDARSPMCATILANA